MIPFVESSITIQSFLLCPDILAAFKKISGLGLDCFKSAPLIFATKNLSRSNFSNTLLMVNIDAEDAKTNFKLFL